MFALPIWLFSKKGIFQNSWISQSGFKSHLPKPLKKKVLAVSVVIFVLVIVFYGFWFSCITKEGVTKRRFFWTKSYSWEDVKFYSLSAKSDGTLQYSIQLKDGSRVSIWGDHDSSNINPKEFKEEDEFIFYLTRKFVKLGIPYKAESWEKLHSKLTYDDWDDYLDKIQKIEAK